MSAERDAHQVLDFLSSLDITGDPPERYRVRGLPEDLGFEFRDERQVSSRANELQNSLASSKDDSSLVSRLAEQIAAEPRLFLLIMHTLRDVRYTNLELVRILFDPSQLDTTDYYLSLCDRDNEFNATFGRRLTRLKYAVTSSVGDADHLTRAIGKQAVYGYLNSRVSTWKRWKSRIQSDREVAQRAAEFAVSVEDFGTLVRESAVVQTLKRSLRTANVETVKAERGKFGAARIKELLMRSGFTSVDRPGHHNSLTELASPGRSSLGQGPFFASEVAGPERKRFDFALLTGSRVRFLIETTYYTTSMSKVGGVVKEFTALRSHLPPEVHLFFITDGVGWFGRTRDVREMLSLNPSFDGDGAGLPFLLNLTQFERLIPRVKLLLSSN